MAKADLLLSRRLSVGDTAFVELKIWRVPSPVRGSTHSYKYSLVLIDRGSCVLRCDNEAGKGDHRHIGELEEPYEFTTPQALIADFERDVGNWRPE